MNAEFIAKAIVVDSLVAADKIGALAEVLGAATEAKLIAKPSRAVLLDRLRERERLGSTGIGNGVAIPHVRGDEIARVGLVVARSVGGIEYDAIDGRPVHTLFLVLAPAAQREAHLEVLRWISTLARNVDFRRFFLAAKTAAEIRDLLIEMSGLR